MSPENPVNATQAKSNLSELAERL